MDLLARDFVSIFTNYRTVMRLHSDVFLGNLMGLDCFLFSEVSRSHILHELILVCLYYLLASIISLIATKAIVL